MTKPLFRTVATCPICEGSGRILDQDLNIAPCIKCRGRGLLQPTLFPPESQTPGQSLFQLWAAAIAESSKPDGFPLDIPLWIDAPQELQLAFEDAAEAYRKAFGQP